MTQQPCHNQWRESRTGLKTYDWMWPWKRWQLFSRKKNFFSPHAPAYVQSKGPRAPFTPSIPRQSSHLVGSPELNSCNDKTAPMNIFQSVNCLCLVDDTGLLRHNRPTIHWIEEEGKIHFWTTAPQQKKQFMEVEKKWHIHPHWHQTLVGTVYMAFARQAIRRTVIDGSLACRHGRLKGGLDPH